MSPKVGTVRVEPNTLARERLRIWVDWRDAHHGIAPTVREFAAALGLSGNGSTSAPYAALRHLVAYGWLADLYPFDSAPSARAQYLTTRGATALAEYFTEWWDARCERITAPDLVS